jgi:hypothetical protein
MGQSSSSAAVPPWKSPSYGLPPLEYQQRVKAYLTSTSTTTIGGVSSLPIVVIDLICSYVAPPSWIIITHGQTMDVDHTPADIQLRSNNAIYVFDPLEIITATATGAATLSSPNNTKASPSASLGGGLRAIPAPFTSILVKEKKLAQKWIYSSSLQRLPLLLPYHSRDDATHITVLATHNHLFVGIPHHYVHQLDLFDWPRDVITTLTQPQLQPKQQTTSPQLQPVDQLTVDQNVTLAAKWLLWGAAAGHDNYPIPHQPKEYRSLVRPWFVVHDGTLYSINLSSGVQLTRPWFICRYNPNPNPVTSAATSAAASPSTSSASSSTRPVPNGSWQLLKPLIPYDKQDYCHPVSVPGYYNDNKEWIAGYVLVLFHEAAYRFVPSTTTRTRTSMTQRP